MKKSPETLSATDIETARSAVEQALFTIISKHPEELPSQGPWWLAPDSTEAEVLRYAAIFGRDHMAELATGLEHDINKYSSSDLLIDFNGASGMNGIMLVLLGLADRLVVVDHSPAAGAVALELAALVNVKCSYADVTSFQTHATTDATIHSIFLLASHAQNVLYFDAEADAALELQNQRLLQILQKTFPVVDTLSAISLEPARGERGLQHLLRPWHVNFCAESFSHVPVAKFGRGLRAGHKKYEAAVLAKALVYS